jgi:hypothetical protein
VWAASAAPVRNVVEVRYGVETVVAASAVVVGGEEGVVPEALEPFAGSVNIFCEGVEVVPYIPSQTLRVVGIQRLACIPLSATG